MIYLCAVSIIRKRIIALIPMCTGSLIYLHVKGLPGAIIYKSIIITTIMLGITLITIITSTLEASLNAEKPKRSIALLLPGSEPELGSNAMKKMSKRERDERIFRDALAQTLSRKTRRTSINRPTDSRTSSPFLSTYTYPYTRILLRPVHSPAC